MTKNDFYYLALAFLPGVGSTISDNLISYCGGIDKVFSASKSKLLKVPGVGTKIAEQLQSGEALKKAEKELRFLEKYQINLVNKSNPNYPKLLHNCPDSPPLLFIKGNIELNHPRSIAIVGTRKATKYGRDFIEGLLEQLEKLDVQVVSGLALGIDAQAHKSAISHKQNTIAVLANSLNTVYPKVHSKLAQDIVDHGGSLISELACQNDLHPAHFPMRNRLIAGLAYATIVVESALTGGAMITAHIANSYNRDVFALPGSYKEKYSLGCNHLIKKYKAQIIENADDLIEQMSWNTEKVKNHNIQAQLAVDLNEIETRIMNLLKQKGEMEFDQVLFEMGLSNGIISTQLLQLELKGLIYYLPGNRIKHS
ncbi:MAG: DNA-protecting protein DprA [Chitinophagales bacterium]|nr:DNA-protecting protein DprA [Chitinophagales bacterium]